MTGWTVILDDKEIDIVFFDDDMDEWHVRHALINHDGYDPRIEVTKE